MARRRLPRATGNLPSPFPFPQGKSTKRFVRIRSYGLLTNRYQEHALLCVARFSPVLS